MSSIYLPRANVQTNNTDTTSAQPSESGINKGQSSRTCSACGKPTQGPFVRALGTAFHLDCFTCMDCGQVVASKFFPFDGPDGEQHALCERDYFRRLNLICAKCGMALRASYITACDKKYHVEHFTCFLCPTLFGAKSFYYEHDGNVYCHFHYSIRFAAKCPGCSRAILKQFVEIDRNMRHECWHPECYMINKFWNVKVSTGKTTLLGGDEQQQLHIQQQSQLPASVEFEEEQLETPASLKEKQIKMEQQVYRIWTVLSAYEESSAACISDMLRQVSVGAYLDAVRMAERFILHVEVLFATIDDMEWVFAERGSKGMPHVRAVRTLCRKTIDLFTLLSHTQETTATRRMAMTQELLALVTGLAHYLKVLIRITLTGALKLEESKLLVQKQSLQRGALTRANGSPLLEQGEALASFLDKLHFLAVQGANPAARRMIKSANPSSTSTTKNPSTQGVTYGYSSLAPENAGESPFGNGASASASLNHAGPSNSSTSGGNPPSDLCVRCDLTIEEDCVRLGTYQRWHSHCVQCEHCGKVATVPVSQASDQAPQQAEGRKETDDNHPSTASASTSKFSAAHRPPARVHEFVYDPDSLQKMPPFGEVPMVILCIEHAHTRCRGGFHAVQRLEQYAFLLNVAVRRFHLILKKQGVISMYSLSVDPSASIHDPYRNMDGILKPSRLDRKLSSTASLHRRSVIVESPSEPPARLSSSKGEEQQRVAQNYQPPQLPYQQQQQQQHQGQDEQRLQQPIPITNDPQPPLSIPKRVPQVFKILGITENLLSRKPKENPSNGEIATNVVNHARTRTDVIPRELLDHKKLPALPIPDWDDDLKEDEPSPPSPSASSEIADGDEPESPTSDETESEWVHLPSQGAEHGTAPWILASRKLQVPKKSLDAEFMLHMAGLRRQIDGGSLRSGRSTLQTEQMSLMLGSCVSLDSTAFSESFSVESLSLKDVEFAPTPVFTDEVPEGLMTKAESSQSPTPTGLVRRGYWNRRGDHLTSDGYIVYPPPRMQYPEELRMYPFENEGYQDHCGQFISYVRRTELPQSLSKHGKPPERPYESFVHYA
ncbi:hypothetical protein M413DRAFT_30219 [Hebeloma cylindrosporum]|uniref:LIM zinc-binding domain-containing protein n=1 Tax=Hebeloma cylindrosporum TaxID=76867 RepID=A0A0C2YBI7_HEBCY|nr:hypothetical protein M413DRAFT_30219 [Hebeloma cylindrosporum h7]